MLYAVINSWTGEIKCLTNTLKHCEIIRRIEENLGEECVIAKVYPDMLTQLGNKILDNADCDDVEVLS